MGRLQNRVAIVTGAGDGIGRGIARAFSREGARVLVAEVNEDAGVVVADELMAEFGTEAHAVTTDVSEESDVRAMVAAAIDRWGTVDILVNNAWGGGSLCRVEYKTNEQMDHGLRVGLYGPLWAMQASLPAMRAQGRGNIINLCSLNGVNAHIGTTEYNCAKEALRTLTRTAAREWAPYGSWPTPSARAPKRQPPGLCSRPTPSWRRWPTAPTPWDGWAIPRPHRARLAVFLASDDARYLTGNTLFVDGGSHINGAPWAPALPDHP